MYSFRLLWSEAMHVEYYHFTPLGLHAYIYSTDFLKGRVLPRKPKAGRIECVLQAAQWPTHQSNYIYLECYSPSLSTGGHSFIHFQPPLMVGYGGCCDSRALVVCVTVIGVH